MQSVNKQLQAVHEQRGLPVLSFGEGMPTTINNILPKLTVSLFCACFTSQVKPFVSAARCAACVSSPTIVNAGSPRDL